MRSWDSPRFFLVSSTGCSTRICGSAMTVGLTKENSKIRWPRPSALIALGELRDRSFEAQRHRASGLNLVVAAIILWTLGQ
jgi:hypothetical protein